MKIQRKDGKFLNGCKIKLNDHEEICESIILEVERIDKSIIKSNIFIMVEKKISKSYGENGGLFKSKIELNYSVFDNQSFNTDRLNSGHFSGEYDKIFNNMSITGGAVYLDPKEIRGNKIGTYLFDCVINWAKECAETKINQINLNVIHANSEEEKKRRNDFYGQFGIKFNYSGLSKPITTKELVSVELWKENIEIIEPSEFLDKKLKESLDYEDEIRGLESLVKHQKDRLKNIRESPLKAGLIIFIGKHTGLFWRTMHKKYV